MVGVAQLVQSIRLWRERLRDRPPSPTPEKTSMFIDVFSLGQTVKSLRAIIYL